MFAFCTLPPHPTPIQPFRPTLPVSSYRIFSLNYTSHVIICETYLYAMYRSHKRAIASESNDPLCFTRVVFYTHNIAGVPIFKQPSPQSTISRSGFSLVYPFFNSIYSILRLFSLSSWFIKQGGKSYVSMRTNCLLSPSAREMLSLRHSPPKYSVPMDRFQKSHLVPTL